MKRLLALAVTVYLLSAIILPLIGITLSLPVMIFIAGALLGWAWKVFKALMFVVLLAILLMILL